jgi:hypothetical protein
MLHTAAAAAAADTPAAAAQVVVSNNPIVLREATIHFGQHGMAAEQLQDAGKLALQAMDWAHEQVSFIVVV